MKLLCLFFLLLIDSILFVKHIAYLFYNTYSLRTSGIFILQVIYIYHRKEAYDRRQMWNKPHRQMTKNSYPE